MSVEPAATRLCLLIEDQPRTRDWMLSVLASAFPDLRIETAGTLKSAHAWLDQHAADVWLAIVDIGLPDGSGVDIVRRLQREHPHVLPVVATIYDDDAHLFEAIAAGARGYVLKDEEADLLVNYLRRIERGEPPLSPSIAHRMLSHFRAPAMVKDEAGLSPRETEVLTLLARGLTVAEAASRLGLQPQTVASYVKVIYQKLCVTSRAEATREAVKRGLA
ncbi:response regulator transcription factor [Devosia sp. Root635]|uniref:response regulator transcription factor n=1 Tax=Devosia sp. Root635 TaxID=1736575 RepID=UPI0006F6B438|nr:response regulator transcription factor [Devosia sp. Root635]KRA46195.1 LuxR family transcriptional regulator [Devosia sp. Root635]